MGNDNAIRFMDNSFSDSAAFDAGNITFSSENTSFQGKNAPNPNRSKVWKPAGLFVIDSTNNKVYINDGADQTATVPSGSYTTPDLLATEIQTQLNAVSTNWTCTYSSTDYKFTIERTSGTNVLKLSNSTNAIWNTIGFTTSIDLSTDPFEADAVRCHTEEWIRIDCGSAQLITFVGVISNIDETFAIDANATIKVQANSSDSWASPALDLTITSTTKGIHRFITSAENSTSYRYWRFYFKDIDNAGGPSNWSVGNIYFGDYATITSSNVGRGFTKSKIDPSVRQQSIRGALYHQTAPKYELFQNIGIANLSEADRLVLEGIFDSFGRQKPLFISLDPALEISNTIDDLTKFFYFDTNPSLTHVFLDVYTLSMTLREVV